MKVSHLVYSPAAQTSHFHHSHTLKMVMY